jgi:hypothetical protein
MVVPVPQTYLVPPGTEPELSRFGFQPGEVVISDTVSPQALTRTFPQPLTSTEPILVRTNSAVIDPALQDHRPVPRIDLTQHLGHSKAPRPAPSGRTEKVNRNDKESSESDSDGTSSNPEHRAASGDETNSSESDEESPLDSRAGQGVSGGFSINEQQGL